MERVCRQCHAVIADVTTDWCPACGGATMDRAELGVPNRPERGPMEVDHRGIVLPRRHALGGIITPQ
ncbi:hypothetical protein DYQ86_18380 [Acidobacteria bacterium AB60]|nr:hypothetical protein DYQ86_18380 [Acidobacteria bacterium AB60]